MLNKKIWKRQLYPKQFTSVLYGISFSPPPKKYICVFQNRTNPVLNFHTCQLLRVLWGVMTPHTGLLWGVIARDDLFRIHLYFFNHFEAYMFFLYKNKEIYKYWVLFVVLLDLRQGLIVLKSNLFSIIWQFVGHGVNIFVWGVLGGDGMWGWWHSVGGVTLEWVVS